jgi:asparagine synthase (glutamine-hydrolysing)
MCGVACIVYKNYRTSKLNAVEEMLSVIAHRGPDQRGVYTKPFIDIGMVRLSILDLTSSNLCPCTYTAPGAKEPTHVLSYNGEIYNFMELRDELKNLGHSFTTTGDTEVLLHAYLEWGEGCLDKFNGMYAFVLADFEKDLLFAARDIAGEKPLYYYEDQDRIIFSSEIKGILSQIPLPEMNMTDEFRAFEYMTGSETLFRGIYALKPAHKLVCRGLQGNYKGKRIHEYWSVVDEIMDIDPSRAVDQMEELLHDSVTLRLRSDVDIGLYLSGGIDSSLLAAIAKPKIVFTVSYPYGTKYNELPFAEEMAKLIGAEQVVVQPKKKDFENYIDWIIYHMDMPVGSFSAFPLYFLARTARDHVKVVLSGEGADELFSGYTRYLLLAHDFETYQIPEFKNYNSLLDYYYGKPLDRFAHLINRGLVNDDVVKMIISPHFSQFNDIRHAMGFAEFKLMLVTLLHMEDRASSAFGIENRSPFLDKRLIAFAYSIPGNLKIQGHTTKWLLKEVAKRHLPPSISERTDKLGLVAPINLWMSFHGRRGEFDRTQYNRLCMERWMKVFFEERWFERFRQSSNVELGRT